MYGSTPNVVAKTRATRQLLNPLSAQQKLVTNLTRPAMYHLCHDVLMKTSALSHHLWFYDPAIHLAWVHEPFHQWHSNRNFESSAWRFILLSKIDFFNTCRIIWFIWLVFFIQCLPALYAPLRQGDGIIYLWAYLVFFLLRKSTKRTYLVKHI